MTEKKADDIVNKYNTVNQRSAMAKRMAEEEQKRNDFRMSSYDGNSRFSMDSWKWKNTGKGGKIAIVIFTVIGISLFSYIIFSIVRGAILYG